MVTPALEEFITKPMTVLFGAPPVLELELLRFLMVLLVMVGMPFDTTIPLACAVAVAVELLFRLATVFPLTVTVTGVPPKTAIPVTDPVPVPAVAKLMLLAVVVLPMVLLRMLTVVVVPPLEPMPITHPKRLLNPRW